MKKGLSERLRSCVNTVVAHTRGAGTLLVVVGGRIAFSFVSLTRCLWQYLPQSIAIWAKTGWLSTTGRQFYLSH